MHCGDLNGKEVQTGEDLCICMADSFCCAVETNTTLLCYTPLKIYFYKWKELNTEKKKLDQRPTLLQYDLTPYLLHNLFIYWAHLFNKKNS